MTVTLIEPGQVFSNSGLIVDAPALVLAANNITVFNNLGGNIMSTDAAVAAIRVDAIDSIIVNQAGAAIAAANSGGLAISGGAGNDLVDNSGIISGRLEMGEGRDTVITRSAAIGVTSLGGGDDTFTVSFSDASRAAIFAPVVAGGAGFDGITFIGIATARGENLSGFEQLNIGATVDVAQDFNGFAVVTLAANGANSFLRSNNPLADLQLEGNFLILDSQTVFRSVTGSELGEQLELAGNGANAGRVTGDIALGDGNDVFRLSANGTNPLPIVYGAVDGGAGTDVIGVLSRIGETVDLSRFTGFEVLDAGNYATGNANVRAINVNNYQEIYADNGGTFTLANSFSPLAALTPGQGGTVVIESTATIGRIGRIGAGALPSQSVQAADPAQSYNIVNNGTVLGVPGSGFAAVELLYGNDLYDSRLGITNGRINGYAGNDTILGGAGNETIDGGFGNDLLDGGGGYDTVSFLGASGSVRVDLGLQTASGQGTDTLAGFEAAVGSAFDDVLIGSVGVANDLAGGGGSDVYQVQDAGDVVFEAPNAAGGVRDTVFTSVSYQLLGGQGVEVLSTASLEGTSAINLTGNQFAQELYGNAGDNVLDGGGGADAMLGFGGSDIYVVDDSADLVFEAAGGGARDFVIASTSYALIAGQEVEVLSTSSFGATTPINLTGNGFAQELYGNAGENALNGGGGADIMIGFGGSDVYFADNSADIVYEAAGGGARDIIFASTGYALIDGQEVEVLSTASFEGTTAINLTGNGFAQELYGNAGDNVLNGRGGADAMIGFGGSDIYFVDTLGDAVYEAAGGGTRDIVFSSADYALTAGQAVEVLSTTSFDGTTPINLSGNALGQEIYGNAGANVLNGGGGADSLIGFGGADTFGFTTAPQLGVAAVADFSVAQGDRMVLSSTVYLGLDASATGGQLNAGAFALSTAAAEADDRIVYNAQTGALLFDADGSGAQAAVQFATLLGAPQDLSAASFSVI